MRKSFKANAWFFPLPVMIIGTYDESGKANAMNAAWGGIYDYSQVILALSEDHKTTKNILTNKDFTISFADARHVAEADYLGIVSGNNVEDKIAAAGLHASKSENVNAPIIEEFPMTLECRFAKQTEDGNIIGDIISISADEKILDENGNISADKLAPISFDPVLRVYRILGNTVGVAFNDGKKLI